jgi:hypothetical protein
MLKLTRFFIGAICLMVAITALVFSPIKSQAVVSIVEQPRWCKRLAKKCVDGNDDACVAWGDYCSHRVRGMRARVWEPESNPPAEVKTLLDQALTESDSAAPTEETMRMTETCGKLLGLCRKGNHTACRVFAQKCVDTN